MELVGTQALAHGLGEQKLQAAPMYGKLRHCITRSQTSRLLPDALTEAVVIVQGGGLHSVGLQRLQHAHIFEFGRGMRQQIDADAEGFELAHAFKYFAFDAALVQHKCQSQATYSGADDDDFQDLLLKRGANNNKTLRVVWEVAVNGVQRLAAGVPWLLRGNLAGRNRHVWGPGMI